MKLGIYVHIPFCNSKCYYCDFCSICNTNETKVIEYINCVIQEIISSAEILAENKVNSIYIGGGTPSAIDAKHINCIMQVIRSCTTVTDDAEITIEVNPESITKEKLNIYKSIGINRISIGLQTANNNILKSIGRKATIEMFERAYNDIVSSEINNISVDIICGLPGDSISNFKKTIEYVLSLKQIKHISSYSLEVHENTKLGFLIQNDFLSLPTCDEERNMKHMLDDMLIKNGYNMYEISNYAKPGFEAKHNIKYWTGDYYLGFGAAASSYINSTRYTNVRDVQKYITGINNCNLQKEDVEELDLSDLQKEFIILGLRKTDGISKIEFKNKFRTDIYDLFGNEIKKNIDRGLLIDNGANIYLSKRGQDVANIVWQEFI